MTERRRDDRVQVGVDCILYVGLEEIEAVVKDISEIGIAFEIPYSDDLYSKLQNKKEIQFAYLDNFIFLEKEIEIVLQASCEIVRVSKCKETIVVGCKLFADNEIRHYVTQRKVKKFMDTLDAVKRK